MESGEIVAGEKLTDDDPLLLSSSGPLPGGGATADAGSTIQGYFLIQAQSDEEAERVASGCPHLRYGGTIEVRRIERFGEES